MNTIPMDAFLAAYDDRTTLIDVREPHEYVQGHVPGATLIPLGQLAQRAHDVPADDTVYVICRSGNRSKRGAETLTAHGINAVSVDEGTLGWIQRRRDVTTGLAPR